MLEGMKLTDRLSEIEATLPADWESVQMRLTTEQASELERAAQVLGSIGVGRVDDALVVTVRRAGTGSLEAARRLFDRLDTERVWCTVEVGPVAESATPAPATHASAAASWDAALADLPSDWSDALCRLELDSSALAPRAALLCAPINPARERDGGVAFTFRAARMAGYGASASMVRRCLERLDAEGIGASVSVLRLLSDTTHVHTQGPVWRVAGRSL